MNRMPCGRYEVCRVWRGLASETPSLPLGRLIAIVKQNKEWNKSMIRPMKRYVIEREIPGVGTMSRDQLKQTAVTSCEASAKLYGKIQWEHSYVAGDKTFCIYLADGESSILEHARLSGFPANKITEARTVIDPMTAFS